MLHQGFTAPLKDMLRIFRNGFKDFRNSETPRGSLFPEGGNLPVVFHDRQNNPPHNRNHVVIDPRSVHAWNAASIPSAGSEEETNIDAEPFIPGVSAPRAETVTALNGLLLLLAMDTGV